MTRISITLMIVAGVLGGCANTSRGGNGAIDASHRTDTGSIDVDSGMSPDSGSVIDAGVETDAGASLDADVDADLDAGLDTDLDADIDGDAAVVDFDAGLSEDGGLPSDGGGAPLDSAVDAGATEDAGVAEDAGPASEGTIGAPCTGDLDCGAMEACATEAVGFPGGYCTTLGCADEGAPLCPGGSDCFVSSTASACLDLCESDADCRSEYVCREEGVCLPPQPAVIGDACMVDGDCGESALCAPEESGFPGGYCISFPLDCEALDACEEGSLCADIGGGDFACLATCATVDDCRTGYECRDGLACLPITPPEDFIGGECTADADCGPGQVCGDLPGGYCYLPATDCAECPGDTGCVDAGGGLFACLDTCATADDCRDGYACADTICAPVL